MSEEPKLEELDRLISMGKQKGYLTYDEVNDALPSDVVSLDQLDDIMMMFGAMDIEVVDSAKAGRLPSEVRAAPAGRAGRRRRRRPRADRPHARPGRPHRGSRCASTCARWAAWPCSRARARSRWPSGSRRARTRSPTPSSPPTWPWSASASCATRCADGDTSVKDVVDVNEEEFTEEKETELTRVVVNAFGDVDRLLRERDVSSSSASARCAARPPARPAARHG